MRLLFLCTHNACRSILCESITKGLAGGRITAASAGSCPAGRVHPLTLKYLSAAGYSVAGLQSKSLDAVSSFAPDAVITVCDDAASESCPVWMGDVARVHWGLADPSHLNGSDEEIEIAFQQLIKTIEGLIKNLLNELDETMKNQDLENILQGIWSTR